MYKLVWDLKFSAAYFFQIEILMGSIISGISPNQPRSVHMRSAGPSQAITFFNKTLKNYFPFFQTHFFPITPRYPSQWSQIRWFTTPRWPTILSMFPRPSDEINSYERSNISHDSTHGTCTEQTAHQGKSLPLMLSRSNSDLRGS